MLTHQRVDALGLGHEVAEHERRARLVPGGHAIPGDRGKFRERLEPDVARVSDVVIVEPREQITVAAAEIRDPSTAERERSSQHGEAPLLMLARAKQQRWEPGAMIDDRALVRPKVIALVGHHGDGTRPSACLRQTTVCIYRLGVNQVDPGSPTIALRLQIARELGWRTRCLDPETGWLWLLERGDRAQVLHGAHTRINDHAAASLALDKSHTAMVLEHFGFRVPISARCLAPGVILDALGGDPYPAQRGLGPGLALAERAGYPLVVKPNRGSRGRAVSLAVDEQSLAAAVAEAWTIDRIALVQLPVPGFDLRIDVLDGELLLAYVRRPLELVGDGRSTLIELHERTDARALDPGFAAKLRASAPWIETLRDAGLTPSSVLAAGQPLVFRTTIYNLHRCCVGALVRDLPQHWITLTTQIAAHVGLRHCGVDLRLPMVVGDPLAQGVEQATVLEVNASPAVGQIAKLGGAAEAEAAERRVVTLAFG
jgi:D-alanine-D-alanine ligase-like ATP-grasp enzyme